MQLLAAPVALLLALATGPGYGLELCTRVERLTLGRCHVAPSNVYASLDALAARGLIEPTAGPQHPATAPGRPRAWWRLTPAGLALVASWRPALAALAAEA